MWLTSLWRGANNDKLTSEKCWGGGSAEPGQLLRNLKFHRCGTASFPSETETGTRLPSNRKSATRCVVALALALRKPQKTFWLPFSSLKYSPHRGAWHTIRTLYGFLPSALSTTWASKCPSDPHSPEENVNQASRNLPKVILVTSDARARIQILIWAGTWNN